MISYIATLPFWVLCIMVINHFRKRNYKTSRYYTPYLPEERKRYIAKLKKYLVGTSLFWGVLLCVPFYATIFFDLSGDDDYSFLRKIALYFEEHPFMRYITSAGVIGWCVFIYVRHQQNIKLLQKLLEEMTPADYNLFTQMMQAMSFTQRYEPFCVICREKIYFFVNFDSEGLAFNDIAEMRWERKVRHRRNSDRNSPDFDIDEILHIYTRAEPNKPFTVTMPKEQYYLLRQVYQEAKNKQIC